MTTIERPTTPTTSPGVDYIEYDERQPLLGASDDTTSANGTPLDVDDKQRDWTRTAVKVVFAFFGAAILGFIVKALLDANIEVCVLCVTQDCLRSASA